MGRQRCLRCGYRVPAQFVPVTDRTSCSALRHAQATASAACAVTVCPTELHNPRHLCNSFAADCTGSTDCAKCLCVRAA